MAEGLFASLYEAGRPFALIDTRERREHVDGHWFGGTNVPLSVLTTQITRMVPDRAFPVHLLDWQDAPSRAAAQRLTQLGYDNVSLCKTSRPDGFGCGFVKGEFVWSKTFGEVVAHTARLPEITPSDYIANHQDALLFDVRPTAEYTQFTIPNSQSLPNSLMLANIDALKNTKKMALLHCAGRTRSIIGACTLKAAGYDGPFAIFRGGTQAWQLDGHEREHGAQRLFAREVDDTKGVRDFLRKWEIPYEQVDGRDVTGFVSHHNSEHLFDVSDDAATGQRTGDGIMKISGTNLIQQTDRSIARYHVPVVLFDHGSGSRAAFAAFWLRAMGFSVRVAYLTGPLTDSAAEFQKTVSDNISHDILSAEQLVKFRDGPGSVLDFRPSQAYCQGHVKGSQWCNISDVLTRTNPAVPSSDPIVIIGNDIAHGDETARLLSQHGWHIAGIHGWDETAMDPAQVVPGDIDSPIDQSALFAGRHHGNMQDSRDYLAWEEELPHQIDQQLHTLWLRLLSRSASA